MCGRYSLTRREAELIERFGIEQLIDERMEVKPRYNIAPSQMVPVIISCDGKKVLAEFRWGLMPFWAKDPKKSKPVINARSEGISDKPMFKQSFLRRRCLIPADGFYEWKQQQKEKIPMFIHLAQKELFAFAGLWDQWRSPDGELLSTCTIITTDANDAISKVHDRMPVIVHPEHEDLWLDPTTQDIDALLEILTGAASESIQMYPVSSGVNKPSLDGPELIEPVQPTVQMNLFDN